VETRTFQLSISLPAPVGAYKRSPSQPLFAHGEDFALFQSLPGAGKVMLPRLIAAFGTRRQRFSNAAEIQAYSGIAPVL
jgi:hypothetical protein